MAHLRPTIPLNQEPGFQGPDRPAEADLYRCVHCGLCLSACPTYVQLGLETESPRGRIAYMKAVHEGRLGISDRVVSHWEMCLQCRACEAVCPSGVPYGRIMEHTRSQVLAQDKQGESLKRVSRLFLRAALPHPGRLRLGGHLLRAYQRSGAQRLLRASRVLKVLPGRLSEMEAQLPVMGKKFFGPSRQVFRAPGQKKLTVGLLSGCVMPLMQGDTMRAAVRVLTRNGCDVVVPPGQGCCGALNLHAGDLELGRRLARRNIDVFLEAGVDRIITASAGCGSSMKEYHELLHNDPQYSEKARRFSELTQDITQFLAELPLDPPRARLERRVTYQDPCHLAHAQRITRQPRDVLKAIPGLELVEMEQAAMCCGSAGFYSLVQPDLAGRILDSKLKNVLATGAEQVVTANPGCMMQIEMGLHQRGVPAPVRHVVDLLDEAYRGERPA
jgi:Fe-S oxidoreductase